MTDRARHISRMHHTSVPGIAAMTMLEVLIAVVILSLTTTSIIYGLTVSDRLRGRRSSVSHALMAANNEVELVRKNARYYDRVGDTLYEAQLGAIQYQVVRKEIAPPRGILGTASRVQELEIVVTDPRREKTYTFRLLQGYLQ